MGVAIVTGGSRGIGAAISEKLAKDGYDVVINCASSVEKAEGVAEKCRAHGVKAVVKQWDVADYAACEAAVKQIKEELGVPAVLVNNAGITRDGLLVRMKPDQFDAVVSTQPEGDFQHDPDRRRDDAARQGGQHCQPVERGRYFRAMRGRRITRLPRRA